MAGVSLYVYSFYYYFHRSTMSGVLQGTVYFGYMALVSLMFSLMVGSACVQAGVVFIKHYYSIATRHELDQMRDKDGEEEARK